MGLSRCYLPMLLMALAVAASALPQSLPVETPSAVPCYIWLESRDGQVLIAAREAVTGSVTLDIAKTRQRIGEQADKLLAGSAVYALQPDTGNLAVIWPSRADTRVVFQPQAFRMANQLRVRLEDQTGRPVAHAGVSLVLPDGSRRSLVVTPADAGIAVFRRVPHGRITVLMQYGDNLTASTQLTLERDRADAVPEALLTVSGGAPVLERTQPRGDRASDAVDRPGEGSTPRSAPLPWPNTLMGLAVVAAAGYVAWRVVRRRQLNISEMLQAMGVDASAAGSGAPDAPAPEPPRRIVPEGCCEFCGEPLSQCRCHAQSAPASANSAPPVRPKGLVCLRPDGEARIPLDAGEVLLGRADTCTLSLPEDQAVSRRHAVITDDGDGYIVKDLDSANGTWLNGVRVTSARLSAGDTLRVGQTDIRVVG